MDVKKTIKRIVALGAGATMLGATVMGAMASLGDFPGNVITDGVANLKVVVGEAAAVSDVLGAIDIAAAIQADAVTGTAVSVGGTVAVAGGKTEDIPLDTNLNDNTDGFGATLDQDDVDSMLDSSVDIDINDVEDTYDVSDLLTFNAGISVETGLTYQPNEDWKDLVFIPITSNAINYNFVFDDALVAGNLLSDATSNDPITINFLGKNMDVTGMGTANTQVKVQVGEEVFMQVGDTVEINGKTIELKNVGSGTTNPPVIVTVDGVSQTVTGTETVNGIKVNVKETFYSDTLAERSATLIIGEEATKTYGHNDEFIGEDKDDPLWRWIIAGVNATTPTLGIMWNLNVDDPEEEDNPLIQHPLYEGESVCLPYNYLCVEFHSLKVSDYKDYEIDVTTKDLYPDAATATATVTTAHVLRFRAKGDKKKGFAFQGTDTGEVYLYSDGLGLDLYYWDDSNSKAILGNLSTAGYTDWVNLDYKDSLIGVDVSWDAANDLGNLSFDAGAGPVQLKYYFEEDAANAAQINWLGHSDSDTTFANDVLYGTRDISGWEEDTRTQYGIVVKDPRSQASGDSHEFSLPSDWGEFKANVIVKGTSTTTEAASGGMSYSVNPIGVGLGILDKDVGAADSNLIVVGGPCANTVAADLLGNPSPCGKDFEAGKATIKFFADRNAVLVAGYESMETLGAAYVLADYDKYALTGTEVEVLVPSLTELSVTAK